MSRVGVSQQQQQQRQGRRQQLPAGVAQRSAKHGPLSEEAQLVGDLQDRRGKRSDRSGRASCSCQFKELRTVTLKPDVTHSYRYCSKAATLYTVTGLRKNKITIWSHKFGRFALGPLR